jgi:hypothetical protein
MREVGSGFRRAGLLDSGRGEWGKEEAGDDGDALIIIVLVVGIGAVREGDNGLDLVDVDPGARRDHGLGCGRVDAGHRFGSPRRGG